MTEKDQLPARRASLIAAAHAAARWAGERRATWTDRPLDAATPAGPSTRTAEAPPPAPSPAVSLPGPSPNELWSTAARVAERVRALAPPAGRWLLRIAAAGAAVGAVAAGAPYLWNAAITSMTRDNVTRVAKVARDVEPARDPATVPVRGATGALRVTSTPAGAQVLVDGKARGVTPLTIGDLKAGRHTVELTSDTGTVRRTVSIDANATSAIDASIFSGWLQIYSPFDLVVSEGERVFRMDDRNQIMLPSGHHALRFVNQALAYQAVHEVELEPGETKTLRVTPPLSTLTVTATEAAEVWLDGVRLGDAPLTALPVQIGVHEIVVKRGAGGERRFPMTITVHPFTLNVDFSKPSS